MNAFTVMILAVVLATGNAFAGKHSTGGGSGSSSNYFYLTVGADTDSDGDGALVTSPIFSTQASCDTAAAAASSLFPQCVARCDPANPKTAYFMEQKFDSDPDDPTKSLFQAIGPFGFLSDCENGIGYAKSAGITDVLSSCMVISFSCKSH